MVVDIGLGVVPGERSFFHENEQHYQGRSHRSKKKNEHIERVLKNIGTIFNPIWPYLTKNETKQKSPYVPSPRLTPHIIGLRFHMFPLTLFNFINKF